MLPWLHLPLLRPLSQMEPMRGNLRQQQLIWERNRHYRQELLGAAVWWMLIGGAFVQAGLALCQGGHWFVGVACLLPVCLMAPISLVFLGAFCALCWGRGPGSLG